MFCKCPLRQPLNCWLRIPESGFYINALTGRFRFRRMPRIGGGAVAPGSAWLPGPGPRRLAFSKCPLRNGSPFGCGKSVKSFEINALSGDFERPAGRAAQSGRAAMPRAMFRGEWRLLGWRRPAAAADASMTCIWKRFAQSEPVRKRAIRESARHPRTSDREHPIPHARDPRDPGGSHRARRASARMTCIRRWILAIGTGQKTSNTKILA